jgi:hypothetical protein
VSQARTSLSDAPSSPKARICTYLARHNSLVIMAKPAHQHESSKSPCKRFVACCKAAEGSEPCCSEGSMLATRASVGTIDLRPSMYDIYRGRKRAVIAAAGATAQRVMSIVTGNRGTLGRLTV